MDDKDSKLRVPDKFDRILAGCGLGCLCQIVFIAAAVLLSNHIKNSRLNNIVGLSWGLTQWIAIVPIMIRQHSSGRHELVKGLIIIGSIGSLLCSACATMILR